MIVIGASLGGLHTLQTLLRGLPSNLPGPLAVVLHRDKDPDSLLAETLQRASPWPVIEVLDKEPVVPGRLFLAPADYHLLVGPSCFSLSKDDPVLFARPSIDVLFESAAEAFGPAVIGLVLTGGSRDGASGAARIERRGGRVLVQDPATAHSPVMPAAAIAAARSPVVAPLDRLAPALLALAQTLPKKP